MWTGVIGLFTAAGCADQAPASLASPAPAAGVTTLSSDGEPATDPGLGDGGTPPIAPSGALEIVPAPALAQARYHHAAAVIDTGDGPQVLVTGGEDGSGGALASAERYDVARGLWNSAGANGAPSARTRHTATALGNGRVLLAGGHIGGNGPALATAELYLAATDEFRLIGRLAVPRTGHTATLLADGRVLLAGGYDAAGRALDSCELYDPNDGPGGRFTLLPGRLTVARAHHAATLLDSGEVLLSGGLGSDRFAPIRVHASADLWNAGTVRQAAEMAAPRAEHTATLLPGGLVLLAGGSTDRPDRQARDDAEMFDGSPAAGPMGMFGMVTARMATARSGHTATRVPGSSVVLLIGGTTEPYPELCPVTVGIERFVPDALGTAPQAAFQGVTETALFVEPLGADGAPIGLPETAQGLTAHVAVALPSGQVLIAGGADCAFDRPVAVARTAVATDASAAR